MAIIVFQHTATEGPGRLGVILRDHGKVLDLRRLDLPVGAPSAGAVGLRNQHIPTDFDDVEGVITLGGEMMVGDDYPWMNAELEFLREAHKRHIPLVGICLGAQMIAKALGGEVGPMEGEAGSGGAEWGMAPVRQHPVANTETMLAGIPWTIWQMHAHGWEVKSVPPGAVILQYSDKCKVQAFRAGMRTYAFQYHFEFDLPMIEAILTSGSPQIAQAGIDPARALDQVREHYDDYARVSDRLCVNMASYLFPVTRAITA